MANTFISIAGTVTTAQLKEVDSSGNLVGGGLTITGTLVTGTIYKFIISYSRYYTLYVNSSAVSTAAILFLNAGVDFFTNASGNTEFRTNIDMNSNKIINIGNGSNNTDAVAFGQVKSLIAAPTSTTPTISMDMATYNLFVVFSLATYSGNISRDSTIIYFYYVDTSAGNSSAVTIDSNGKIAITGKTVIQSTEKAPVCVMPKIGGWRAGKYVHFGYVVMNSAGHTTYKYGTAATVAAGWIGLDATFPDLSSIVPSPAKAPLVTDTGSQIIVTIPVDESPTVTGDFEIAYNFLLSSATSPVGNGSSFNNFGNYVIERSSSRTFVINKPILSANTASYKIWVSYRFINPFSYSYWWTTGSPSYLLKGLVVTKFSSKLNADDIDALIDQVIDLLYVDTGTGIIARK